MTAVKEELGYSERILDRHISDIDALRPSQEDPHKALDERKKHVADLFDRGDLTPGDALRLAMYVTHGVGAGRQERQARMAYMDDVVTRAQTGETALAVTVHGATGGMIDGPLGMTVDREFGVRFAMDVPFAQLPDDPRQARIHLGHMLLDPGHSSSRLDLNDERAAPPLVVMDRLLVGPDEIADYVRGIQFKSLRKNAFGGGYLDVERDGKLLTGLYQAGLTLAECGIDETTRQQLHERLDSRIGSQMIPTHEQALHVVSMDRLT